jgi:type I restriction enzyme S subunit
MKAGWEITTLGKVCSFDKIQGVYQNLPYVGLENIESNTARFIGSLDAQQVKSSTFKFSDQHILYGRLRPYLNKVLAPDFDGHCSTEIFPIKLRKNAIRDFLLYWFLSDETVNRINGTCTGSRMPRADMKEVLGFEIPLPPLSEQRRIVAILDEAFAGIVAAKENAEQNLKNAKEVFEAHLQGIFVASKQGWSNVMLGDICKITDGTHFSPKNSPSGDYMYVTAKNIKPYYVDLSNITYICKDDHQEIYKRCPVKKGDVLYIKDGATAGIASVNPFEHEFSLLSSVALIKCGEKINNKFLVHYMNSSIGKENFLGYLDGAAITRLTLTKIKNVYLSMPDYKKQCKISEQLDSLSAETSRLESLYQQKLSNLEELKKSLLQQAFIGAL